MPEKQTDPLVFQILARSFLLEDLKVSRNDPDYPRWERRCVGLFTRFDTLNKLCPRPLGDAWADEIPKNTDEQLDMLERKIKAAEETLGLTLG